MQNRIYRIFFAILVILNLYTLVRVYTPLLKITFIDTKREVLSGDFIEYWSAQKLFEENRSPYDTEKMLQLQRSVDNSIKVPIMMWNPPWTLSIISPFISGNFRTDRIKWYYVNLFLGVFIAFLSYRIINLNLTTKQAKPLSFWYLILYLIFTLTFPPFISCFYYGQISIFLATGVTLYLYFTKKNLYLLAGSSLVLLTIKLHLFWLFWLFLLLTLLRDKDRKLVPGFLITLISLISITYYRNSASLENWFLIFSQKARSTNSLHVTDWTGPTLPDVISLYFLPNVANASPILSVLIPGIIGILTIYFYSIKKVNFFVYENLLLIITLSIWLGPFGWWFDLCSILSLIIINSIGFKNIGTSQDSALKENHHIALWCILLASNFISTEIILPHLSYLHQTWWYFIFLVLLILLFFYPIKIRLKSHAV